MSSATMSSAIIPAAGKVTVILSAELDWRDADRNALAMSELRCRLARQLELGELEGMLLCDGAYKGTPEASIAITGSRGVVYAIARREAEHFNQESFLAVGSMGGGYLHYLPGRDDLEEQTEHIGHYQTCRPGTVDAWTTVRATGETFTFMPMP